MQTNYEVIIIGGSYSGLSAAMALGRSLREVLIIDNGLPCNRFTPHSHNVITHDGATPSTIRQKALEQVLAYANVHLHQDTAVRAWAMPLGFMIMTAGGNEIFAKKLLFATGVRDTLPGIAGLQDCWGISTIHCPYCHGYEFRQKPTGILANGDVAFHYATLLSQLTKQLTVFTDGQHSLTAYQLEKLEQNKIPVIETPLREVMHTGGYIEGISLIDGTEYDVKAAYIRPLSTQHCSIPEDLSCALNELGLLVTDSMQKTSVDGVYAAGDCCTPMRSVTTAIAQGTMAGAAINMTLCTEAF